MRLLSLAVDFAAAKISEAEQEQIAKMGLGEAFNGLLRQGLNTRYPNGMPVSKGKVLARIEHKLDVVNGTSSEVRLEETEYELLKEVFCSDDSKFAPAQYRIVVQYIENIQGATKVE